MGPLIPPFRYMPVEDGVYRSAYPTEKVCNVGAQGLVRQPSILLIHNSTHTLVSSELPLPTAFASQDHLVTHAKAADRGIPTA
jgi:hypothetical protein